MKKKITVQLKAGSHVRHTEKPRRMKNLVHSSGALLYSLHKITVENQMISPLTVRCHSSIQRALQLWNSHPLPQWPQAPVPSPAV